MTSIEVQMGLFSLLGGQNTTYHTDGNGRKSSEKMGSTDRLSQSSVRVQQKERLIVLCIDCGCVHVLTHPRDHWESKEKIKKEEEKTEKKWKIINLDIMLNDFMSKDSIHNMINVDFKTSFKFRL